MGKITLAEYVSEVHIGKLPPIPYHIRKFLLGALGPVPLGPGLLGNMLTSIQLTHWGRVTHICVGNLTIIGSDNGFSPGRRQAIIWTNAVILSIGPLGTNFSEMLTKIITFSFKKMRSKVSSRKRRPSCLGLNVSTGIFGMASDPMVAMLQANQKPWLKIRVD